MTFLLVSWRRSRQLHGYQQPDQSPQLNDRLAIRKPTFERALPNGRFSLHLGLHLVEGTARCQQDLELGNALFVNALDNFDLWIFGHMGIR